MFLLALIMLCALFPLLIRIALLIGLLMACVAYAWLAGATVMAFAVWLLRRARAR